MEAVWPADVPCMNQEVVKRDQPLQIERTRMGGRKHGNSSDPSFQWSVEGSWRPTLYYGFVHVSRFSLASWWQMPSMSCTFARAIKGFDVMGKLRDSLVTAQTRA